MNDVIHKTLAGLGLNEKEISIYIMLLQVGTAPASVLGSRTGIQRSTAQYTCQQLAKKGVIRMIQRTNSYLYTAEPPEKLLFLVEEEKIQIEQKEQNLHGIIGDLKNLMNPNVELPKVRFFEGEYEMIQLFEQILSLKKPIDSIEESGELFETFPEYPLEFVRKRVENKSFNRCIAPKGNPLNVTNTEKFIEVRNVDENMYPFTWHIKICGNIVGIFSFEKNTPMAISIENKNITQNFKILFEFMWNTLNS